jgi:hypothetical protein
MVALGWTIPRIVYRPANVRKRVRLSTVRHLLRLVHDGARSFGEIGNRHPRLESSLTGESLMTRQLNVLVTGSSGLIGGVVTRILGDKYIFAGLDRVSAEHASPIPLTKADVVNFDAIRPAFDGMDAVYTWRQMRGRMRPGSRCCRALAPPLGREGGCGTELALP